MSIYQCDNCGCAENTSLGAYHSRNSERLTPAGFLGKKLCSACAPTTFANGKANDRFNGLWHGRFKRVFLPKGEFFTNNQGNIEHISSGLIGNDAYRELGSSSELF